MKKIILDNISFAYGNDLILKNINLTMDENDFILLNGPNGAGKTTLVALMMGLLKPKMGTITYQPDIRRHLTYIPQRGYFHSVPMKAVDVVASSFLQPNSLFFQGYKKSLNIAWETLEKLGLQDLGNKEFSSLSGGQAQKILLARVLSNPQSFIFLDEPFSNIDEDSRDFMTSQLMSLRGHSGIVIISHDMDLIADHQGRFCYLKQGVLTVYQNINEMEISFFHDHSHIHHFHEHILP